MKPILPRKRAPVILGGLVLMALLCLSALITVEQVESITRTVGQLGLVLLGSLLFLTQVIAPLSGTPIMLVAIKLYGYSRAMGMLYMSCLLSSVVNYWIARKYGRDLLAKLVGERSLKTIDELSRVNENALLVSFRVFGYSFFDLVSYAVGLTMISFKKYFVYTALLTLIPFTVQYFLFSRLDFNSFGGTLFYIVSIALATTVFAVILRRIYLSKTIPGREAESTALEGK